MTRLFQYAAAGVILLSNSALAEVGVDQPSVGQKISNQYICLFDNNVSRANAQAAAHRAAGPQMGQILHVYENSVRGFAVRFPATIAGSKSAVEKMKSENSDIRGCVQDGYTRTAQRPGGGSGGGSKEDTVPWGVARVGGPVDLSGTSKRAWVIDSGVDLDHKDLRVDTANARSFLSGTSSADDGYGHGTHVAGTIAAKKDGAGVVGVAAGAWVVPVRVLDNRGVGPDSGVIAGIDYAAGLAAAGDVINLSLIADSCSDPDGDGSLRPMDEAAKAAADPLKPVFVVIAAGNSNKPAENYCPGRAEEEGSVFTVAASDSSNLKASFSNYGTPSVDYYEPGVSIYSTDKNGRYGTRSGTSMAAPHLSGILLATGALPKSGPEVTNDSDADTVSVIGVLP